MNFYISDLHFGCVNRHDNRTLDHDRLIRENWNKIVTNGDTVYILGDIGKEGGNKENESLCEKISVLKGRKILIQGNHDKLKDLRIKQLFAEICPYKEVSDNVNGINYNLVLCHYPILMWNNQHKGWIHLYGHLHTSDEETLYQKALSDINEYFTGMTLKGHTDCPPARAYNVGCMLWNYTPVTLKQILEGEGKAE